MIEAFTTPYATADGKAKFKARLRDVDDYESYQGLLSKAIEVINEKLGGNLYDGHMMDPQRVRKVNFGDYQGTLLLVVGGTGYQPRNHWVTVVAYGSCGGCDTLQSIQDGAASNRAEGYYTLALHMLQQLKEV